MADQAVTYEYQADVSGYVSGMSSAIKANQALDASIAAVNAQSGKFGKTLTGIVMGVGGMVGMKQGTLIAAGYEKQLSSLKATTTVANKDFGALSKTIKQLSRDFPQSFGESRQVVEALNMVTASGGKSAAQLKELAVTTTKLAGATGTFAPQMAQDFGLLAKQFGNLDPKRYAAMADSLTKVSAEMGTSAQSVAQFSKMIGPLSQQAGIGQAAVQGISAAFTSLGEEGGLAANSFNQILSMMNKSVRDGTPELQFFADMVGQTNAQFTQLFKENPAEAIAQLFDAIGKGGPNASRQLEALGLDSTRLQRQVALLSQSGTLRTSISTAVQATGGGATAEGAEASFGGLSDSMQKLGETSKQLSAALGEPLLGPMSAFISGLGEMAEWFLKLADNPVVQAVTTTAGAVGGAASMLGTAALGAWALRSSPARGLMGGFAYGAMGGLNATDEELQRTRRGRYGAAQMERYSAGMLGPFGTGAFQRTFAAGESWRSMREAAAQAGGATRAWGRAASSLAAEGIRSMYIMPFNRGRGVEAGGEPLVRTAFTGSYTEAKAAGAQASKDAGGGMKGMVAGLKTASASLMNHSKAVLGDTAAVSKDTAAKIEATRSTAVLSQAFGRLATEALAFGGNMAKMAGGGIMNMLGGPAGLAMAGIGVGIWGVGKMKENAEKEKAKQQSQLAEAADPFSMMRKYNDALGLATPQVAALANASGQAADGLVVMADAMEVSAADISAARAKEERTGTWVGGNAQLTAEQISTAFGGELSASQLQSIKVDLVGQFGAQYAREVLALFQQSGGTSGATLIGGQAAPEDLLAGVVARSNRPGDWNQEEVRSGTATAVEGVQQKTSDWEVEGGAAYASAMTYQGYRDLISQAVKIESGNDQEAALEEIFGGAGLTGHDLEEAVTRTRTADTQAEAEQTANYWLEANRLAGETGQTITQVLHDFTYGTQEAFDATYGKGAYEGMAEPGAGGLPPQVKSALVGRVETATAGFVSGGVVGGIGEAGMPAPGMPLGTIVLESESAKQLNEAPGDIVQAYQTGNELYQESLRQGYSTSDVAAASALGAATTAPGQYQEAFIATGKAAELARQEELRGMGTGERFQAESDYNNSIIAGLQRRIDSGEELTAQEQQLYEQTVNNQISLESQQEEYLKNVLKTWREYYVQRGRMQEDHAKQEARAQEDYGKQRARAQEDFQIQMSRAQEDYNKQRFRANRDFNIQVSQAMQDYNKQRMRAQRDFDKQMARQAQDAAKSFYDPYRQIQVQNVWDTQNLLVNMKEQNEAIRQQKEGIEAIKKLGLSQQAIDLMGLADSQNAQQLQQILADSAMDPALIEQLNAEAAARVDASGQLLTESPSYKRAIEDFNQQMDDMEQDFYQQLDRQREAFDRQMDDMATDYATQMQRAQDDFAKSMARMAADFDSAMRRMNEDYYQGLKRAEEDVNRATEEITGSLEELTQASMDIQKGNVDSTNKLIVDSMDTTIEAIKTKQPAMMEALADAGLGGWVWDAEHGYFTPGGTGGGTQGVPRADGRFQEGSGSFTPPVSMSWPPQSTTTESANTKAAIAFAKEMFDGIGPVYGFGSRPKANKSDHPKGKALDIMIPNYASASGQRMGQSIANWWTTNANQFGTRMVIWRDQANEGRGWKPYGNPGGLYNDTGQHRDHVHVSLLQKGGVVTSPTLGIHGEAGPETVLPLDQRGAGFFTEVLRRYVSAEDVRAVLTAPYATPVVNNNHNYSYDQRTMFTGDVKVTSNDPNDMARRLAFRQRRARATRSPIGG